MLFMMESHYDLNTRRPRAVEKRMKGDYEVLTSFSESDVTDLFDKMKKTLRALENLL